VGRVLALPAAIAMMVGSALLLLVLLLGGVSLVTGKNAFATSRANAVAIRTMEAVIATSNAAHLATYEAVERFWSAQGTSDAFSGATRQAERAATGTAFANLEPTERQHVFDAALATGFASVATATPRCECSANLYDCADFADQAAAQACYGYCLADVGHDVHWLDADADGVACEGKGLRATP